jgi:hypothetical protein
MSPGHAACIFEPALFHAENLLNDIFLGTERKIELGPPD